METVHVTLEKISLGALRRLPGGGYIHAAL